MESRTLTGFGERPDKMSNTRANRMPIHQRVEGAGADLLEFVQRVTMHALSYVMFGILSPQATTNVIHWRIPH
jgi:hypothetical protein